MLWDDHPSACGCAVCVRHRERLESDPAYAEREASRVEMVRQERLAEEPVTTHRYEPEPEPEPEPDRHTVFVRDSSGVLHERYELRPEQQPVRVAREATEARLAERGDRARGDRGPQGERGPRGYHAGRTLLTLVLIILLLHSFYPQLNVPGVPFVACGPSAGAGQAAGLSTSPAAAGVEPSGLKSKIEDLAKSKIEDLAEATVGRVLKTIVVTGIGDVLHFVGETVRMVVSHPPSAADIADGLQSDFQKLGLLAGWVWSALGGAPVSSLPGTSLDDGSVAGAGSGCGTCPGVVAPVVAPAGGGVVNTARAALRAGWTGEDAVTAVAIAGAESTYNPTIVNSIGASGLWQIRRPMHNGLIAGRDWRNPAVNADVAHKLWAEKDAAGVQRRWSPWTTYTSGAYRSHLTEARAAVLKAAGLAPVVQAVSYVAKQTTGATHGLKPSALRAEAVVRSRFGFKGTIGGYSYRNIAGTHTLSKHASGLAIDVMVQGDTAMGARIRDYFAGPAYKAMGVDNVIYQRRIYNSGRGWHPYVGVNPHTDHVHIDFLGANAGMGAAPSVASASDASCRTSGVEGAALTGTSVATQSSGSAFALATFNVLGANHHRQGPAAARMALSVGLLRKHGVDAVGLQELQSVQAQAFNRLAGGSFGLCHSPRNTENAIAYRKSTFTLADCRTVNIPYFHGQPKPMTLARLRYRHPVSSTSSSIWLLNVHNPGDVAWAHHQQKWRDAATRAEVRVLRGLQATGRPVFITGDANDRAEFTGPMRAAGMRGVSGTQVGRIDQIFGGPGTRILSHVSDRGPVVRRASDHPIVVAKVAAPGVRGLAG